MESVHIIDKYTQRLMDSEYETDLLKAYYDNLVIRLGAYDGEVIKRNINQDFQWYESKSVYRHSTNPAAQ